jgi:hypothetical protein
MSILRLCERYGAIFVDRSRVRVRRDQNPNRHADSHALDRVLGHSIERGPEYRGPLAICVAEDSQSVEPAKAFGEPLMPIL